MLNKEFLNKLNEYYAMDILKMLSSQKEDRKEILNNEKIREKLKRELLDDTKYDLYAYFREVLEYLSPVEFISLFTAQDLDEFFVGKLKFHKYKLFACLLEKDVNGIVEYLLNNDEMFNEVFNLTNMYYSLFYDLKYDLLKKVVFKIEKSDNTNGYEWFLSSIDNNNLKKLVKENLGENLLIWVIQNSNLEVINEFFKTDERAKHLYNHFDIKKLAKEEVSFNDEILKKKDFFDKLYVDDFIDFRYLINKLEKNNNVDIIWRKLNQYYNYIINQFDVDNNIFSVYKNLLDNPELAEYGNFTKNFIIDDYVLYTFRKYINYDENNNPFYEDKDILKKELEDITSEKLSLVVVDALFKDNIYNVKLNINEMIRYNSKLDEKILDNEKESFYKMILEFNELTAKKMIEAFYKYRNEGIDINYYNDLRELKDKSYEVINNELFVPGKDMEEDPKLSFNYDIPIYDLRNKKYTMLIRGMKRYKETTMAKRNCYSLISDENTNSYGGEYVLHYGYSSFDINKVLHVLEQDSFSIDTKDESPSDYVNRIMTPRELVVNSSWYSEIDIVNEKVKEGKYASLRPDYIIAYDIVTSKEIEEAKRLNLPIVIIEERRIIKFGGDMNNLESEYKYVRTGSDVTYERRFR